MNKTNQTRETLQVNFPHEHTFTKIEQLVIFCGGVCDWAERRIAAHLGMKRGTYRDHRRRLERAGRIELTRRRIPGRRFNDANLLRLKGGGSKIQPQKIKNLNTNTTTPRETPRGKSYAQLLWEWRRQKHPHRYVGRCSMRFREAWKHPFNAVCIAPPPDEELTPEAKRKIDEARARMTPPLPPLYMENCR